MKLLATALGVPALSALAATAACWPIHDGPLAPQLLISGLILTTGICAGLPACFTWLSHEQEHPPMPHHLPTILTTPPRRRLGHQTLVLNRDGAVLLVATAYRNGLTLPGGSAEANELPHLAARRHTETETGLVLPLRHILATDYVDARTLPEGINFVYWGGTLTSAQETTVARHRPPATITAVHWLHPHQLADAMPPDQHRRTLHALTALTRGIHLPFLLRGTPAE
ncbi:NUDIX domain-containing protein [Kitasatospora sp. NPDC058115]|uniref:NUDIX domain-containing protein n=1 Tax=Kitasatospora sp. NPDC058115 TaxID=3346347 RepID=UPI0036DA7FDC